MPILRIRRIPSGSPAEAEAICVAFEVDHNGLSCLGQLVHDKELPQGLPNAGRASDDELLKFACRAQ